MTGERAIWLVWASQGEYSDRSEWPVVAFTTERRAKRAVERLSELYLALCAIYKSRETELEEAGDWNGDTLYETTTEGKEFLALGNGGKPTLNADPWGYEVSYYCCELTLRSGRS
jgi:hypothetical protein